MDFETIFAKRATHIKPGIQRIQGAYNFLGQPGKAIPAVLIAGTNGKGSTSGFLWHLLALNGLQVGLYSSPHLAAFGERFQLSEKFCTDAEIDQLLNELKDRLPEDLYAAMSFFELATLLAFQLFQAKNADYQVLEVGLGGRWDATNVSDPLVSAVVSLSLDHQDYLGDDLITILDEKLGVMRPNRPLFWGNSGEICLVPGYSEHIAQKAAASKSSLFIAMKDFGFDANKREIWLRLPELPSLTLAIEGSLNMAPDFLLKNLSMAAAMYHYLATKNLGPTLRPLDDIWPELCAAQGSAPATLFGRSQRLRVPIGKTLQRIILDVCHNPDGVKTFIQGLAAKSTLPMPALVSILRDKDRDGILDLLRSALHPVILFGIDHERAWQPEGLAVRHQDLPFYANFEEAWQAAQRLQLPDSRPIAICGSVLVVGQVLQYFACAPRDGIRLERVLCGDW